MKKEQEESTGKSGYNIIVPRYARQPQIKERKTLYKKAKEFSSESWRISASVNSLDIYKAPYLLEQSIQRYTERGSPLYTPQHLDNQSNTIPYHPPLLVISGQIGNKFHIFSPTKTQKIVKNTQGGIGLTLYPYAGATPWRCSIFEQELQRLYYQGELIPWRHCYAYGYESKSFGGGRYNKIMVITNLLLGDEGHIPNDRFTGGVPDPENVVERPI
jgi:hypothetical protein